MEDQDRLIRAYVRLKALRDALAAEPANERQFPEHYVEDYHAGLEHLGALGFEINEFRIPEELVRARVTAYDSIEGTADYSDERYVERGVFFAKLDAVLSYFSIATAPPEEPRRSIGFQGPTE